MMSKVYVVAGGTNYEGENMDSVRVFADKQMAEIYGESLVIEGYYDYYEIVERDVE